MPLEGIAELPLHDGHVPAWLARYMKRLARAIIAAIVELSGPEKVVEMLSDPVWFQALNNAIGMDWDSSGSTTVTLGILKEVVNRDSSLGLYIAGGKGNRARKTPDELREAAQKGLIDGDTAEKAVLYSRLAAKTDTVLLQDGYTLYHHTVILSTSSNRIAIVQQGMNTENRLARRYHWLEDIASKPTTIEPHKAIAALKRESSIPLDLTSRKSIEARKMVLDLPQSTSPRLLLKDIVRAHKLLITGGSTLDAWLSSHGLNQERVKLLAKYYKPQPLPPRHLEKELILIREYSPRTLEELIMIRGVGPAVVRSLALISELVYNAVVSHTDPATDHIDPFKYAYIVGGKDGVPYPFRSDYASKVIEFLENIVREARLDEKSRQRVLDRLKRLSFLAKRS